MLSALLFPVLLAGVYKKVPAAEKADLVVFQELESEESRETYEEILTEYTEETGTKIRLETYSSSDYRKELEAAFAEAVSYTHLFQSAGATGAGVYSIYRFCCEK